MTMKNIVVLTYWSFNDALIQTYTIPYIKIIKNYLFEVKKWWSSSEVCQIAQDNKNSTHSSIYKKLIKSKK